MSQWIKVTDLKGNPILINMEYSISVHKDTMKEEEPGLNVVKLKKVTNVMMDKDWGYVVKEDPRLIYDLILESEVEYTYDPSIEDREEDEGDSD